MSKVVGKYQIKDKIGKGNYADVYIGYHIETGERYAIKVISKSTFSDPKLLAGLESEIRIMKEFIHPNLIQLYRYLNTEKNYYLVLEYCIGGDLSKYIKMKGHLSEYTALHFLYQLAEGLSFLNKNNFIHRDLKPANVLLSESSDNAILKIADFGFARHLGAATLAQTRCGTPLYMAPEILEAREYDAKADVWSVGCIFYEMLIGICPFRGVNEVDLLNNIKTKELKLPKDIEISKESKDILIMLLQRQSFKRATVDQLLDVLRLLLKIDQNSTSISTSKALTEEQQRSKDTTPSTLSASMLSTGNNFEGQILSRQNSRDQVLGPYLKSPSSDPPRSLSSEKRLTVNESPHFFGIKSPSSQSNNNNNTDLSLPTPPPLPVTNKDSPNTTLLHNQPMNSTKPPLNPLSDQQQPQPIPSSSLPFNQSTPIATNNINNNNMPPPLPLNRSKTADDFVLIENFAQVAAGQVAYGGYSSANTNNNNTNNINNNNLGLLGQTLQTTQSNPLPSIREHDSTTSAIEMVDNFYHRIDMFIDIVQVVTSLSDQMVQFELTLHHNQQNSLTDNPLLPEDDINGIEEDDDDDDAPFAADGPTFAPHSSHNNTYNNPNNPINNPNNNTLLAAKALEDSIENYLQIISLYFHALHILKSLFLSLTQEAQHTIECKNLEETQNIHEAYIPEEWIDTIKQDIYGLYQQLLQRIEQTYEHIHSLSPQVLERNAFYQTSIPKAEQFMLSMAMKQEQEAEIEEFLGNLSRACHLYLTAKKLLYAALLTITDTTSPNNNNNNNNVNGVNNTSIKKQIHNFVDKLDSKLFICQNKLQQIQPNHTSNNNNNINNNNYNNNYNNNNNLQAMTLT